MTTLIAIDDPLRPDVLALLEEHLADMFATSPAESVHALDPNALTDPRITFLTARDGDRLLGTGALLEFAPASGEIKSMRTALEARGRGIAAELVTWIIDEARRRGYSALYLETGSQEFFAPARRLYARHGFAECGPFGDYRPDPNSVFMTLDLTPS